MDNVEAHTTKILGSIPASEVKSSAARFAPGDVLYGRLRPYLNKVARPDFEGLASAEFIVLPDQVHLRSSFLQSRLNSRDFVNFASHINTGDRPRVDFDQIGEFEIELPPEKEQSRIVSKIEELFSDLDAGVAALEKARANLKRYRAAVLKAAVEGRLTEQWRKAHPDVEPASKLLERILAERRKKWEQAQLAKFAAVGKAPPKGWKEKYPEPAKPDSETLPELPAGWCWVTIEQLNIAERPISYGVLQPGDDLDEGVPLIRVGDVNEGEVAIGQLKRINPAISEQYQRTIVQGGEVLLTIVGTIGRTAVVPQTLKGANTARAVAVIPVVPQIDARYLEITLRETSMRVRLTQASHEVARKTLNLEDVRVACLPFAPREEQDCIIDIAEEQLTKAGHADAEISRGLSRSSSLRQSILKHAFEGKLVPQDPNDEPASVLLERIRNARAAEGPQRAHKRRQAPA